ncbi:MAG: DUF2892 domain-containing protein [Desulfobacteraceae bacterium]|nr:MAG: DUF2892 domain-containing protein [Desulfobacteraceae bacterium]
MKESVQSALPSTARRVPDHTADHVNERIKQQTIENLKCFASGSPEAVRGRMAQLDAEWDIERTLEANASAIALIGLALGAFVNKKFLILPGIVAGFLLQHALQGWCPPVPVFRRMGFRTSYEIDQERYALKAYQGDFGDVAGDVAKSAAAVGIESNGRPGAEA